MEAKSLMIGDWVINPIHNDCVQIEGVCYDKELHSIVASDGRFPQIYFEPIPITPEILEKNGFEPNEYGDWIVNKNDYLIGWSMIRKTARIIVYSTIEGVQQDAFVSCSSVNELQHALRLCGLNELADNIKLN